MCFIFLYNNSMKILVAINYVDYDNEYKRQSQQTALTVLAKNRPKNVNLISINFSDEIVNVPPAFNVLPMLKEDSQKKLGNNRRLPYIREILDLCSSMPCDFFGYMNSDILIKGDFYDIFSKDNDAYVFYKRDIEPLTAQDFINNKIKVVSEDPCGQDAFFFRKKWWLANRGNFSSELVYGESEWDTCFNTVIQNIAKNYVLSRSLYHINHDRVWTIDSRGAINNKLIWDGVRTKYGLPKYTPETRQV